MITATASAAAAAAAVLAVSARWNWWRPKVGGLASLMYHKVGDHPPGSKIEKLWVTAKDFRRQMEWLKSRGYATLTFTELKNAEDGKSPMPARPALVTFDDGYANNYELAFPILAEMGMKGNIFLVWDTVGRHNAWHDPAGEPWLRMLTWGQVGEMQRSGVIEFGSHTVTHRNLAEISLEDVAWEARESKKRLEEKLGRGVLGFAYPYGAGAFVPEVRRCAREAGYRYDFSIKQGITPIPWDPASGPMMRLLIRGDDTMVDFHLNMTRGRARL
ncbi:MAG: polysaccharide deacetylase family protein [Elusimicrobia bacterium]|nr:polysaccharide deacetylase family protein [Elusimicrobiota bacterium]